MQRIELFRKLAEEIGASVEIEPEFGWVGYIQFKDGRKTFFNGHILNINKGASIYLSKDKGHSYFLINKFGYKVPEGQTFFSESLGKLVGSTRNIDEGYSYAQKLGFPVIVKPNDLSQGKLVTKVYSKEEYYEVATKIFEATNVMLVQRFYKGNDYRVVVFDGQVIAAYQRLPFSLTGDGHSTVLDLIKECQARIITDGGSRTAIKPDDFRMIRKLARQALTLDSIPKAGQVVEMLDNANLSTGGAGLDFTNNLHPIFANLAINVTQNMGLRLCGVDFLTEDITKSSDDYVIIEINSAPGFTNYARLGPEQRQRVEELYRSMIRSIEAEV